MPTVELKLDIDFDQLRTQKRWLCEQQGDEVEGLLSFIDAIQDQVVDSGQLPEKEVFPQLQKFVTGWNMPGYMPDNEPGEHDNFDEAYASLLESIQNYLDEVTESEEPDPRVNDATSALTQLGLTSKDELMKGFSIRILDYVYWLTPDVSKEEPCS